MYNSYINDKLGTRSRLRELELSIIQFNCNGLSGKLSEFKIFLYSKKPNVV